MIRRALLASSTVLGLLVPVAVVAAPAAHAGGGCHSDATAARGDRVSLTRMCFEPATLFVEPGTTVTFTNDEDLVHNVTGRGLDWGRPDQMLRGDTLTESFADPGVYAYSCTLHPGMVGAVVVGDPTEALRTTGAPTATAAPVIDAAAAPPAALSADTRPVAAVRGDDSGLGTGSAVAIAVGAGVAGAAAALALTGRRVGSRRRTTDG
jgi:plastocyanin